MQRRGDLGAGLATVMGVWIEMIYAHTGYQARIDVVFFAGQSTPQTCRWESSVASGPRMSVGDGLYAHSPPIWTGQRQQHLASKDGDGEVDAWRADGLRHGRSGDWCEIWGLSGRVVSRRINFRRSYRRRRPGARAGTVDYPTAPS